MTPTPSHLISNYKQFLVISLIIISLFLFIYLIIFNKSAPPPIQPTALTPDEENAFLDNYSKIMAQLLAEGSSSSSSSSGGGGGGGADGGGSSKCTIEKNEGTLTREVIGNHVWNVFHAFVENYREQDDKLLKWIQLTAELFPCKQCSNDFQGILKKFPYRGFENYYNSKSQYMCRLHNLVNRKTHKEKLFDCNEHDLLVKYKLQKC